MADNNKVKKRESAVDSEQPTNLAATESQASDNAPAQTIVDNADAPQPKPKTVQQTVSFRDYYKDNPLSVKDGRYVFTDNSGAVQNAFAGSYGGNHYFVLPNGQGYYKVQAPEEGGTYDFGSGSVVGSQDYNTARYSVYDNKTGQSRPMTAQEIKRADIANRALGRTRQRLNGGAAFGDITDQELESDAPDYEMLALQKYLGVGGHGEKLRTAFGGPALTGRVDARTRAAIQQRIQEEDDANRAVTKNLQQSLYGDKVGNGDSNGRGPRKTVSEILEGVKPFTNDMIRFIEKYGDDYSAYTPEQKIEAQQIASRLTGRTVKEDAFIGRQTLSGIVYAALTGLEDRDRAIAEAALENAGITINSDGTLTMPHKPTYDEFMASRREAQEQANLRTQQRELERRKARAGLGELGAMIGDVIRGSQGANVASRDTISQIYNQLDANQKQNYDNYVARIEKQRADLRAERQRLADQAFQNEQLEKQHKWDIEKEGRDEERQIRRDIRLHGYDMEKIRESNKAALDRLTKELDSKEGIAAMNSLIEQAKLSVQNQGNSPVIVNGTKYTFDKFTNKTAKSLIYGYLVENMDEDTQEKLENIESKFIAEGLSFDDEASKQAAIVDAFIGSGKLDKSMLDGIEKIAKELSTGSESVSGSRVNPTALVFTAGDKKYQKVGGTYIELDADGNATGTPLTAAQFNEIMRGAAGGGNASNNGDSVPSKGNDGGVEEYFTQH